MRHQRPSSGSPVETPGLERPGPLGELDAYLAGDRRRALASGSPIPDRAEGCALFADISGFTPLTEALVAELGPQRGAEELTANLNIVFDAVLGQLHEFGGSVIYFSGDAVTCWLDGDNGTLAVACALAMQAAMGRVGSITTPAGSSIHLGMKVAVAAGPARRFVVGDPDIQLIDVLAGELMDRLAAAEHHADRGEVVVDARTLGRLEGQVDLVVMRGGVDDQVGVVASLVTPLPPLASPTPYPRLPRSVLRQWLLPSVYERATAGGGDFLAELRPAVPMFVRFGGIDYDEDPDAHRLLDHFIRRAQQVIDSYGGNVLNLTIGDKGAYLHAVFGCPLAHEDDAARACAAALEVIALEGGTAATGLQVGVASGRLRSGAYGHRHRRAYSCLGDPVNLAARLMSAAPPGQVYVTAEVAREAGGSFNVESLDDLTLKGKAAPVAARRLVARNRGSSYRQRRPARPLLGRAAEITTLMRLAQRARMGQGQVIAVVAEAGMGKSRLVEEALKVLGEDGLRTYAGAAASVGSATSYLVWQDIWSALLGVAHDRDVVPRLEKALAEVDVGLVPRLPLLGAVLGMALDDNDLTSSFDAKLRKTSLESLLLDYLSRRAGREPLVLLLEDCHWMDPLSADLLDVLARAVTALPVLIVLTYRPGSFSAPQLAHTTLVELDRLHPGACRQLLSARLEELYGPETTAPEPLWGRLLEQADGNPFYLEELISYLHAEGADLTKPSAASLPLPSSLSSLVLSRIDTLAEPPRRTLKVASVVGREFGVEMLTGAYPELGQRRHVQGWLRRLCAFDLVVHDEPLKAYAFKHAIIRDVAYESMPFAQRSDLHGRVGAWLEIVAPLSLDLLAHHFWHSTDEAKKRDYLVRAGEAAQARYANDAAVDYFQRVVPLLVDQERGPVLLKLGAVLELRGDWPEAAAVYTDVMELAQGLGDESAVAWARTSRSEPMRKQGHYEEAEAELDDAWAVFQRLSDISGLARVAHVRGLIANLRGDPARSQEQFELSLEIRRALGDRRSEATLLGNLAMPAAHQGQYELAQELSEQALAIRTELGDRWGIGVSLNNIGMLAYLRKDFARARSHLEEALRAGLEVGDLYGTALSQHNLGNAIRELGDIAAAGNHYSEALRIYSLTGDQWSLCMLFEDISMLSASSAPREAFRLVGASDALRQSIGSARLDYQEAELDEGLAVARQLLGDEAARERAAGQELDVSAGTELASRLCRPGP